jgi:hypothetical protein
MGKKFRMLRRFRGFSFRTQKFLATNARMLISGIHHSCIRGRTKGNADDTDCFTRKSQKFRRKPLNTGDDFFNY